MRGSKQVPPENEWKASAEGQRPVEQADRCFGAPFPSSQQLVAMVVSVLSAADVSLNQKILPLQKLFR
jgi:hypothetical protein